MLAFLCTATALTLKTEKTATPLRLRGGGTLPRMSMLSLHRSLLLAVALTPAARTPHDSLKPTVGRRSHACRPYPAQ